MQQHNTTQMLNEANQEEWAPKMFKQNRNWQRVACYGVVQNNKMLIELEENNKRDGDNHCNKQCN